MFHKIRLYLNTVKYLKPLQIYYRPINRIKRKLYNTSFIKVNVPKGIIVSEDKNFLILDLDFNTNYLNRFNIKEILKDCFTFLNATNKLELSNAWNNNNIQHLWRYNLHYFEYLYKLAYLYLKNDNENIYSDKAKYLIKNWIDNNQIASGDGWHPYTVSLRLTNWITIYPIFKEEFSKDIGFNKELIDSIYLQYSYLQKNLEKDVLGNHYFENIKAVIIASIFFNEEKVKNKYRKELLRQLDEQILKDGMHFELSPLYHKIILEGLIKITYWLRDENIYKQLIIYIQKMINVAYSFEENFGKTPAFNDSADSVGKDYRTLINTCEKYFNLKPEFNGNLEDSGFYIVSNQSIKLIFDVGEICPRYIPAHGHCDALSFELSIDNKPVIVNSGTYKYENGEWRNYFRSTKSHNTVMINGFEQSQFWSSFRVATRIKNVKRRKFEHNGMQFYAGSYISFNGHEHKRVIGFINQKLIIVLDYINQGLNARSYLHFIPEAQLNIKNSEVDVILESDRMKIFSIGTSNIVLEHGWYSKQFNIKEKNKKLIFKKNKIKDYFGYLIDISKNQHVVSETKNSIKIKGEYETIINFDRLGVLL